MEITINPIDPRKTIPQRYALYERLRARTATLSYTPSIPVELLHVNQLNQPKSPLGDPMLVRAFSPFDKDCSVEEVAAYMDMAAQALVRTQLLCVGRTPTTHPSPDSHAKNTWHVTYATDIPLSLGELRPFRHVVATAKIITQEKERTNGRTAKRFITLAGLAMGITGLYIKSRGSPTKFSTHAEIIDDWTWANDAAVGAKGALQFPARRIASVLQYTDVLRFVENHCLRP